MKNIRIISLLLAVIMLLGMFAACQNENGKDKTTEVTTVASSDTEEPTENVKGKVGVKDNLPDNLDFNGSSFSILIRGNEIPNWQGDETATEVVSQAVWKRNKIVESRLNISLAVTVRGGSAAQMPGIMNDVCGEILAGSTEFDICDTFQMSTVALSTSGMMAELTDAKYLDLSQIWWWDGYNEALNLTKDHIYMLGGDINCVSGTQAMSAIYFSKTLLTDLKYDVDEFYKKVLDGEWYYDDLLTMSNGAYSDLNGNTVADKGDRFGMNLNIDQAEHFTYTAGIKISGYDEDGYRTLDVANSKHLDFLELLNKIYHESIGTYYVRDYDTDSEMVEFSTDRLLFLPRRLVHADILRNYDVSYGIIPFPKYQETQEKYYSMIQNNAAVVWVPITTTDVDTVSAVLEAVAAESYRRVLDAYYETALKVKSTELEDENAAKCIDLIHDGAICEFAYIYSELLSGVGIMCRDVANGGINNLMSSLDKTRIRSATKLEDLYEIYESMNSNY